MKPTNIHFIIGIGRSGTTLLTSILNQHPEVLASPENFFLVFFSHSFLNKKELSDEDIESILEFNRIFGESQPYIGWNYDENKLRQEIKENRKAGFRKISEIIYRNFSITGKSDTNIHNIVDKNPAYTLIAEKLNELLPSAKFLLAVRDYRANVLSWNQTVYFKGRNTVMNCIIWDLFNKHIIRFKNNHPEKCHLVLYEKMVMDAPDEVKKMIEFLDLDAQDGLLEFYKKENQKLNDPTYQELSKKSDLLTKKYSDLAKPINASRMDSWKTELSEVEIRMADIICGRTGSYFGYEMQQPISNRRIKKMFLYLTHPKETLIAHYEVYKGFLLYHAPLKWKLKRFGKVTKAKLKFLEKQA